jgi:hypothetical protein
MNRLLCCGSLANRLSIFLSSLVTTLSWGMLFDPLRGWPGMSTLGNSSEWLLDPTRQAQGGGSWKGWLISADCHALKKSVMQAAHKVASRTILARR